MKAAVDFVAFYVLEQEDEFGWMHGSEVLVENLLFGLCEPAVNGKLCNIFPNHCLALD